jgi:hypothetical protein
MMPAIFRKWILVLIFISISQLSHSQKLDGLKFRHSKCYAGIEVGSKGVKWTVLEIGAGGKETGAFHILKDSSLNTDFINFNAASFRETLKAVVAFYKISKEKFLLTPSSIFTVFSSGVQEAAQKEGKITHLQELVDSLIASTGDTSRYFPSVNVAEEARLSHLGIIPEFRRYTSFLIDIGSGNTKGGYFPDANPSSFKLFQLPWGTRRLCHAVENRLGDDATFYNFKLQLKKIFNGPLDEEVAFEVNSSGGYDLSDQIVFSGGVVWALSNLMFPRLVENTVVPVSFNELKLFAKKLEEDANSCKPQWILQQYKEIEVDKNRLEMELLKIENVFTRRDLLSGAYLLMDIMRQFESAFSTKEFFLIKQGQVGWISAYVDAQAGEVQKTEK